MAKKKTWREKLADDNGLPKVVPIPPKMVAKVGSGTLVVPAPREVDAIMRQVPKGKITTINEIRACLARKHGATVACPMTSGIFAWVAAHAAEEERDLGKRRITPWWRTLKTGGLLNDKYPGGIEVQRAMLEAEGHEIEDRGKKTLVREWEKHLFVP
ncbi:MAG: MGMT family protein [Pseudomonadota bacterium]